MTTEQKIEAIKEAIEKAKNHQSKMDETAWNVPALSSLKIRHLMNNLGTISTHYFECGVHIGGLFCSTIRNNPNLKSATANDSFESDKNINEQCAPRFYENKDKCISEVTAFNMMRGDTFAFNPEDVLFPIDLYLFDADHSYDSQRKAMTHFLPAMADEFIVCVDDYDWDDVSRGTQDGLKDAGVEILFEESFKGGDHDNLTFWNGYYLALVRNNKIPNE